MSGERLAGWAQTIALSEGVEAVVAVRRGEFGQLRLPDREPMALSRRSVDELVGQLRMGFASGADLFFGTLGGEGLSVGPANAEPLIALLRDAVRFSEGA